MAYNQCGRPRGDSDPRRRQKHAQCYAMRRGLGLPPGVIARGFGVTIRTVQLWVAKASSYDDALVRCAAVMAEQIGGRCRE